MTTKKRITKAKAVVRKKVKRIAKAGSKAVEEMRTIQARPEAVFNALTLPYDWQAWFCQEAKFDARPKAKWEARWEGGYEAKGTFTALEPGKKVALTWEDAQNPKPTKVEITLKASGSGTQLTLRHTGFGQGPKWAKALTETKRAWAPCLDNLKAILETGIDQRLARRPMMGIGFDVLSPENAKALGAKPGSIKLGNIAPGMAAEKAGLKPGDVLVTLDKKEVTGPDKLIGILSKHLAGDKIEVTYLRNKKKQAAVVELSPRKMTEVSPDPKAVVAKAREAYKPVWEEMDKVLSGVTEEEAGKLEAPGKWSVKHALAHLSVTERDNHQGMIWEIMGLPITINDNPTIVPERLQGVIDSCPTVQGLLARYKKDVQESWNILLALRPEVLENKVRYRRMAESILFYPDHAKSHLGQMKRVLSAVRGT